MTDSRPTVLVLGARGRLGAAAAQAFAAAGWRVLAQARRAEAATPAGVEPLAIGLADPGALANAARGARAVIYGVNPPYTAWDTELLPLARQGMAVAERLGALFMLPGNVYAFGEGMPAVLCEDTPERPTQPKGRQRQALETEMAERAARHGLRSVVIRAGDFFGGDQPGTWIDLLVAKDAARGRLVYPGPRDLPHAWAYLPDLARAFVAVAARDDGRPGAHRLHFAGHTVTGHELLDAVRAAAQAQGLGPVDGRFIERGFPWPLIRAAGLVWPMGRELARMSYLWRVPHRLDGQALTQHVGTLPITPLAEAMARAVAAVPGPRRAVPPGADGLSHADAVCRTRHASAVGGS